MNRGEALELAAEALELAGEGRWKEVLALPLPGEVIELIRRKAQLNAQISNLEQQEVILWELIVELLQR